MTNKIAKTPQKKRKRDINTSVLFKNLKSIKEKAKKTASEIAIHMSCLPKKFTPPSSGTKDFIVTNPAESIGKIKRSSSQSILLKKEFESIFIVVLQKKYWPLELFLQK